MRDDPRFDAARGGRVGAPALVRTPVGLPAFWLVPLLAGGLVCGLAHVDLDGRVMRTGMLGTGSADRRGWIDPEFFQAPPRDVLDEIAASFPGATVGEPVLSYDTSPTRWAWRLEISRRDRVERLAYISPGGWYQRPPAPSRGDLEG